MSLISFKNLNKKNQRKIINIISSYYPYENIDDIYSFFLKQIYELNCFYFISKLKTSLVGVGYKIYYNEIHLYWPFIFSKNKYLGQHEPSHFLICKKNDIDNFIKLYNSTIGVLDKTKFIYLSNYGMEKEITNILCA